MFRELILNLMRERSSGKSIIPKIKLRKNFESKSVCLSLHGVKLRKLRTLSYDPWMDLLILNLKETNRKK